MPMSISSISSSFFFISLWIVLGGALGSLLYFNSKYFSTSSLHFASTLIDSPLIGFITFAVDDGSFGSDGVFFFVVVLRARGARSRGAGLDNKRMIKGANIRLKLVHLNLNTANHYYKCIFDSFSPRSLSLPSSLYSSISLSAFSLL